VLNWRHCQGESISSAEPSRPTSSWTGQIFTLLVVLAVLLWFVQMRRAPMQLLEQRDCQHAYADAHSAAESLAVDARQPLEANRSDRGAVTCGELRRGGRL
jgi:hypothetical protein